MSRIKLILLSCLTCMIIGCGPNISKTIIVCQDSNNQVIKTIVLDGTYNVFFDRNQHQFYYCKQAQSAEWHYVIGRNVYAKYIYEE